MAIRFAKRMDDLPPYLFAEINRMRDELVRKGKDVVDLGIGDPDFPTPEPIVRAMQEEVAKKENHNYPPYLGLDEYREAAARFFEERYSEKLDPKKEVIALIGSKEGIFHLPLALLDPGDWALVPDPGYPVYSIATSLIGGNVHPMPLLKENGFLPDLSRIPEEIAKKAKVIFVNYPNNPTSACADRGFFRELFEFACRYNLVVAHDAAYAEIYFGNDAPPSFLNFDKERERTIEFHSLSKTFNMTGWRAGFAVGGEKVIGAMGRLKTNIDSGIFKAVQRAAIAGLKDWKRITDGTRAVFSKRAARFSKMLKKLGYSFKEPKGTFYLWVEVPGKIPSMEFTKILLERAAIAVTPGVGMGKSGEGYFRISITTPDARLDEAIRRFESFKI